MEICFPRISSLAGYCPCITHLLNKWLMWCCWCAGEARRREHDPEFEQRSLARQEAAGRSTTDAGRLSSQDRVLEDEDQQGAARQAAEDSRPLVQRWPLQQRSVSQTRLLWKNMDFLLYSSRTFQKLSDQTLYLVILNISLLTWFHSGEWCHLVTWNWSSILN